MLPPLPLLTVPLFTNGPDALDKINRVAAACEKKRVKQTHEKHKSFFHKRKDKEGLVILSTKNLDYFLKWDVYDFLAEAGSDHVRMGVITCNKNPHMNNKISIARLWATLNTN